MAGYPKITDLLKEEMNRRDCPEARTEFPRDLKDDSTQSFHEIGEQKILADIAKA